MSFGWRGKKFSRTYSRKSWSWKNLIWKIKKQASIFNREEVFAGLVTRDTHQETGDPARLPAQLARLWEQRNLNCVRRENKSFVLGRLEQPRQNKNLLYRHDKPNEPTNKGPLPFVLFESPFSSVSTVNRAHPSLVSACNVHIQTVL